LDEENDYSYKSSQTPRYHARQVAYFRAKNEKALLVLGSATPSVETYYYAITKRFKLYTLFERFNKNPLPKFYIVDLKEDTTFSRKYPFTTFLIKRINENLEKNEQIILFLNRRGFSNFVLCKECGYIFMCEKCNVSLTYHKTGNKLICHYCGATRTLPGKCDKCNSTNLTYTGAGTQKIESILSEIFPDKKITRLDLDVSRKKGKLKEIISDFEKNNINILTGTQIISKGLNFPNVTLVGILYLDDILNLPDFRASENIFNLIVQVSGRAGRDKKVGEVIIQTYLKDHFAIKYATSYQFQKFYLEELNLRKKLNYPPFCRLIKLTIEGKDENKVARFAGKIHKLLSNDIKEKSVEMLGPAPAPISKIKSKFRYQILIKTKKISYVRKSLNSIERRKYHSINVIIDIDPVSLL